MLSTMTESNKISQFKSHINKFDPITIIPIQYRY